MVKKLKAIINGTVLCPTQGLVENAIVLFNEEKIHSVSTDNLSIPQNAIIIDAKGKFIVPGYIDPHCHQGLFDGSSGWAGADGNEMTDPVTPHVRGIDAFNPEEPSLKEVLHGGVTCINTGPGSGNVISGQTLIIKPIGSHIVDEMIVKSPAALKVALGENPKRVHGQQNKRMPMTRMGVAAILRNAFTDAQNYIEAWKAYNRKLEKAEKDDKPVPAPPKRDLKLDILSMVLRNEIPVHAHCHRADDIATVMRIAEEFSVQLVLIHATDSADIADFIAQRKIPAIYGPTLLWVGKPETKRRSFNTVVKLVRAGVKVALQTDSLTPMNFFPLLPMLVKKAGLSEAEALRCVTLNPAEILGIDNKIGSLEAGKDADIVIWSGNPFDFYSEVEKVFINGKEVKLESKN
jgi:imidazolonepropionase-like amidohydrolase